MLEAIAGRLLIAVPTVLLVSVIVFALQLLLPADPALALAGEERDPVAIAQIRALHHLDRPIPVRHLLRLAGLVRGDLGTSLETGLPVAELIASELPVTIELALLAMLVALAIGIPAGVAAAVRKGGTIDAAANPVALAGISIPNFWLGIVLIPLVSVRWNLLPASGYTSPFEAPVRILQTTIVPAFVLGTGIAAVMMRHTRNAMLTVLRQDYVRTARAMGPTERRVVGRHALRNALLPVVTLGTLELGTLLSGAVLTEQVFTIPGFGELVVDAVFTRDYPVVQGVVLCAGLGFVLMSLLADLLYVVLNPRLRT